MITAIYGTELSDTNIPQGLSRAICIIPYVLSQFYHFTCLSKVAGLLELYCSCTNTTLFLDILQTAQADLTSLRVLGANPHCCHKPSIESVYLDGLP
jgi:hypothetical protein